jgi:hypothetical protein
MPRPIVFPEDYRVDVMEWGFADLVGAAMPEPEEG